MRYATAALFIGCVVVAACSDVSAPTGPGLTPSLPSLDKAAKVTICHAAGQAGTTHYITITTSANGENGHFDNSGTPKAGHEQDFIVDETHPCPSGQLQICVVIDPGAGGNPANPPFAALVTATASDNSVVYSHTVSATLTDHEAVTSCSEVLNVVPGTYVANEAAPGITDPPPPSNGTWYIGSLDVSPSTYGVQGVGGASPELGTVWDAVTSRGVPGWAKAIVGTDDLTVVTFYNRK